MKLTKSQLKQIIKEELENINEHILERSVGPSVYPAFKAVRDLYGEAETNKLKKKIEDDIIYFFNNMIQTWREERNASEKDYTPEM